MVTSPKSLEILQTMQFSEFDFIVDRKRSNSLPVQDFTLRICRISYVLFILCCISYAVSETLFYLDVIDRLSIIFFARYSKTAFNQDGGDGSMKMASDSFT